MPDFFHCKMKGEQAVRGEEEVRARGSQRTEEGRKEYAWLACTEGGHDYKKEREAERVLSEDFEKADYSRSAE